MPKISSLGTGYNSPVLLRGTQRRTYPFQRDSTHYLVSEDYVVNAANYAVQARNTANGDYASAYNVSQEILREVEDAIFFRRTYATIPATRIEPAGTFNVRLPGLPTVTPGTALTPSSGSYSSPTLTLDFSASHGLSPGDIVQLSFRYTRSIGGVNWGQSFSQNLPVATAPDADTITISMASFFVGVTISSITNMRVLPISSWARRARDANVDTYMQYEYALPGVTSGVTNAFNFQAVPVPLSLDDSAGTAVNTLTSATTPTAATYIAWIEGSVLVPIESHVRPYLGNILERATRYYVAQ